MLRYLVILTLFGCGSDEKKTTEEAAPVEKSEEVPVAPVEKAPEPVVEPMVEPEPIPEVYSTPEEEEAARLDKNILETVVVGDPLQGMLPEAKDMILAGECQDWGFEGKQRHCSVFPTNPDVKAWYYYAFTVEGGKVTDIYVAISKDDKGAFK